MKRYLLFSGYKSDPDGGWKDFWKDFDNIEDAMKEAMRKAALMDTNEWYHIVDTQIPNLNNAIIAERN